MGQTAQSASSKDGTSNAASRKIIERLLLSIAIFGTALAVYLYGDLAMKLMNPPVPKHLIYGTWVEQDVAPYATEKFIVSEKGVIINGSVVTTDFEFDGKFFEYQIGNETRRYRLLGQSYIEMRLESQAHYQPVFKLKGKQDLSVR